LVEKQVEQRGTKGACEVMASIGPIKTDTDRWPAEVLQRGDVDPDCHQVFATDRSDHRADRGRLESDTFTNRTPA
jgi:hypothetical protein